MTLLSLVVAGCGGSTVDLNAAFASIQVDEARIERASLAMQSPGDDRAADRDEVCAASSHLCDTARPLDDRDANARCARSQERCVQAREELAP